MMVKLMVDWYWRIHICYEFVTGVQDQMEPKPGRDWLDHWEEIVLKVVSNALKEVNQNQEEKIKL